MRAAPSYRSSSGACRRHSASIRPTTTRAQTLSRHFSSALNRSHRLPASLSSSVAIKTSLFYASNFLDPLSRQYVCAPSIHLEDREWVWRMQEGPQPKLQRSSLRSLNAESATQADPSTSSSSKRSDKPD